MKPDCCYSPPPPPPPFQSGRLPYRLGNTRSNFIPWSRPDGLNLGFDTVPLRLKRQGYSTHHVGK
jgi:arylsulfatase A-like enzyme